MTPSQLPIVDRVDSNLSFLILEVTSQVENVRSYLHRPSQSARRRINMRDDYVDSLKRLVEEQCFRSLHDTREPSELATRMLRATITIAENLERVGDLCINLVGQAAHLDDQSLMEEPLLDEGLTEVLASLQIVQHALSALNVPLAMRICETERKLDQRYTETFKRVHASLVTSPSNADSITFLNMVHYLERMGDMLLNIGEAIVFAAVGARMKLGDYIALADVLEDAEQAPSPDEVQVERIWDSRSGMRIGVVLGDEEDRTPDLIVKEGNLDKLLQERDSISRWQALCPGLAPRVLGYREDDRMAALLMEYLHGRTLQALLLAGPEEELSRAYERFEETVLGLWETTRNPVPTHAAYTAQIMARLQDVQRLHPGYFGRQRRIGSLTFLSLDDLLVRLAEAEASLEAPFSVFIHGDFNTNNVIYDGEQDRVHFVDLYRSTEGDYLQDASVFLVSCFRTPVFDRVVRSRLDRVAARFLAAARGFAHASGDDTCERRLAMGLIRSFITSARFVPDAYLAEELFVRATYLMEASLRPDNGRPLRVPDDIVLWKGGLAA
jgi:phosphate uptake regulator